MIVPALSARAVAPVAGPLCFAAGATALSIGRDALAASYRSDEIALTLAGYGLLLLLAYTAIRLTDLTLDALGLSTRHISPRLVAGLVMGGVLAAPAAFHNVHLSPLAAALPAALAVSIVEELLFRGVVFALLARALHPAVAVALSSLAFAAAHAAHYPPLVLLLGLVVGLLLGIWRWLADDLVAPIVAHAMADIAAALAIG